MYKLLLASVMLGPFILAQEPITYTFQGVKDPRLSAKFIVRYIGSKESEECMNLRLTTGTKRPVMADQVYDVPDGNYSITMPVALEDDVNNCGYQFRRIELALRRKYDDERYSLHVLLDTNPTRVSAIYYGKKSGFGGTTSLEMPSELRTDKKHYRIADETTFLCATKWFEDDEYASFFCRMQIGDGEGDNRFVRINESQTVVTHPRFGINEIKSETLHLDIQVEEERCTKFTLKRKNVSDHFREAPRPWWAWILEAWQQLKTRVLASIIDVLDMV